MAKIYTDDIKYGGINSNFGNKQTIFKDVDEDIIIIDTPGTSALAVLPKHSRGRPRKAPDIIVFL